MNMIERVARAICAQELGGFCSDVGGSLGCKVGRGTAPHHSLCKASESQLMVSGRLDTARAALMVIRDSDPTMSREVRRWIDAALNEKG